MIRKIKYAFTHSPNGVITRYKALLNSYYDEKKLKNGMKKALWYYGICYEEYLLYGLHERPHDDCKHYIGEITRYKYYKKYNACSEKKLFRDKHLQSVFFKEFYKRDTIYITKKTQLDEFILFAQKQRKFIVKPCNKSCGYGIEIINYEEIEQLKRTFIGLLDKHRYFICEELLQQSDLFSRFNPTSLNTVRFICPPKEIQHFAFTPFFRMGRYGKAVDNAGAGGIFASIDEKSGIITSIARDENGFYYPKHPDSKASIKGFELPEWENALNLIDTLQKKVQSKLISWDIAHTQNKGWVLVEANYAGQLICQQSTAIIQNNKIYGGM